MYKAISTLFLMGLLLAGSPITHAQLAGFTFTGAAGNEISYPVDEQPENGTVGDFGRGPGSNPSANAGRFSANNWPTDQEPGIDLDSYYTFTISANEGFLLTLTSIQLDESRSSTGIRDWEIRSSLDNFTATLQAFNVPDDANTRSDQSIELNQDFINLNSNITVEFRIYAYNAEAGAGTWRVDNVEIFGSIGAPDLSAPEINQINIISENQLDVLFSEAISQASAENTNNYVVNNAIGNPNNAQRDGNNPALVHLTFAANFQDGIGNTLTINNIEDLSANVIAPNSAIAFTYFAPILIEYRDIIINEIMADPTPTVGLPDAEFVELYNRSDKNINLQGWVLEGAGANALPEFFLTPNSYVILCNAGNINLFNGNVLSWGNGTLTNGGELLTLRDNTNNIIDQVTYDDAWYQDAEKSNGGWTLELINPNLTCSGTGNWIASDNENGGTPNAANSVLDNLPDNRNPLIASSRITANNQLEITFDEIMNRESLLNASYVVSNNLEVINAIFNDQNLILSLTFDNDIEAGIIYTLSINDLTDCEGNPLLNNEVQFGRGIAPAFHDLVISEIMADPTNANGVIGLPNAEFFEIYNRSEQTINLEGCKFMDEGGESVFPNENILPGEYIIICHQNNSANFSVFGKTIGIAALSLNNSGESLQLRNADNSLIFSVKYDDAWYQDTDKDDGAYSLEMIDVNNPCLDEENWIASNDETGGTPGRVNSVNGNLEDNTPPALIRVNTFNDNAQSVELIFSKKMDSLSVANGNYTIDPVIIIESQTVLDAYSVRLDLADPLQEGTVYSFTATNVRDCSGNLIAADTTISIGIAPEYQEIIITEIMADPSPEVGLPAVEFLEIYNTSDHAINLAGCTLSDESTSITFSDQNIEAHEYVILCDDSNEAALSAFGKVIVFSSFISLSNDGERLSIRDKNGSLIFSTYYDKAWYGSDAKDDGGYTLEMIDITHPCLEEGNWIGSSSPTGGTPGEENSVAEVRNDQTGPEVSAIEKNNDQTLLIVFSEKMDSLSVAQIENYSIQPDLNIQNVQVIGASYRSVQLSLNAPLENKVYTIGIQNVMDCSGNTIAENYQTYLGIQPDYQDIIISEIMANPADESENLGLPEAEYIEIYNASDKVITLEGCTLSDDKNTIKLIGTNILPDAYIIICSEESKNDFLPYGKVMGLRDFPGLDDDGEELTIKNKNGKNIFTVNYTRAWFQDPVKSVGAYSLEMIDLNNPCIEDQNWIGSESATGGTPGAQNSVADSRSDGMAPQLVSAQAIENDLITLSFNEKMDSLSLVNAQYIINPPLPIDRIEVIGLSYKNINLHLAEALSENQKYTIQVAQAQDCSGNLIDNAPTLFFGLAQSGDSLDVVLSEILFNPMTGGDDFVEIYNNSEKYINLKGWQIGSATENGEELEIRQKLLTEDDYVLAPGEYVVLTKDILDIQSNYPASVGKKFLEISAMPGFNDDKGIVLLINPEGRIFERFDYTDDLHNRLLDDKNGVSLERISFSTASNEPKNWFSAAERVGFATPGYANSQQKDITIQNAEVSISPKVFTPDEDGNNDFATIQYNFDTRGLLGTIIIYDSKGRPVRRLVENNLLATQGFFTWDGTSDTGERVRTGYYVVYFQAFGANGEQKAFKQTVVVSTRF